MAELASYKVSKADVKKTIREMEAFFAGTPPKSMKVVTVPAPATPAEARAGRAAVHLSQTAFASALGVSPGTVRSWERGRRRPGSLETKVLRAVAKEPALLKILASI